MIFWLAVIVLILSAVWSQSASAYAKLAVQEVQAVKQLLLDLHADLKRKP